MIWMHPFYVIWFDVHLGCFLKISVPLYMGVATIYLMLPLWWPRKPIFSPSIDCKIVLSWNRSIGSGWKRKPRLQANWSTYIYLYSVFECVPTHELWLFWHGNFGTWPSPLHLRQWSWCLSRTTSAGLLFFCFSFPNPSSSSSSKLYSIYCCWLFIIEVYLGFLLTAKQMRLPLPRIRGGIQHRVLTHGRVSLNHLVPIDYMDLGWENWKTCTSLSVVWSCPMRVIINFSVVEWYS